MSDVASANDSVDGSLVIGESREIVQRIHIGDHDVSCGPWRKHADLAPKTAQVDIGVIHRPEYVHGGL